MKTCPNCGASCVDSVNFCPQCNHILPVTNKEEEVPNPSLSPLPGEQEEAIVPPPIPSDEEEDMPMPPAAETESETDLPDFPETDSDTPADMSAETPECIQNLFPENTEGNASGTHEKTSDIQKKTPDEQTASTPKTPEHTVTEERSSFRYEPEKITDKQRRELPVYVVQMPSDTAIPTPTDQEPEIPQVPQIPAKKNKGKTILWITLILFLLLILGFCIWFFLLRKETSSLSEEENSSIVVEKEKEASTPDDKYAQPVEVEQEVPYSDSEETPTDRQEPDPMDEDFVKETPEEPQPDPAGQTPAPKKKKQADRTKTVSGMLSHDNDGSGTNVVVITFHIHEDQDVSGTAHIDSRMLNLTGSYYPGSQTLLLYEPDGSHYKGTLSSSLYEGTFTGQDGMSHSFSFRVR